MTQAEMLTQLSGAIDDRLDVTWTPAEKRTHINKSMRIVARLIARHQGRLNYANGSATITTDGTNSTFATSQPSYYRHWKITRTDTTPYEPVCIIDERESVNWAGSSGFDPNGFYVVFLTQSTSGDTKLGFPVVPPANLTFLCEFSVRPSELATDGTAASSTYTLVPEDFHEAVVYDAAVRLGSGNGVRIEDNKQRRDELFADLVHSLADANRVGQIHNAAGYGGYG